MFHWMKFVSEHLDMIQWYTVCLACQCVWEFPKDVSDLDPKSSSKVNSSSKNSKKSRFCKTKKYKLIKNCKTYPIFFFATSRIVMFISECKNLQYFVADIFFKYWICTFFVANYECKNKKNLKKILARKSLKKYSYKMCDIFNFKLRRFANPFLKNR